MELYYKSEDLKKYLANGGSGNKLKTPQFHEFLETNKRLILADLELALQKKCEVDLWNLGFKDVISQLQADISSRSVSVIDKNKKSQAVATFNAFLDFASGFYVVFLQEICIRYDLDLPFLRSAAFYGLEEPATSPKANDSKSPNVANVNYICTHILIHLGDVARYGNQLKQAENFYKQSLKLTPNSGHSYNQLALLEMSSKGCQLTAVFFYIRAIALKTPFPAASSNLSRMYNKIINTHEHETDLPWLRKFLLLQAFLHSALKLKRAKQFIDELIDELTEMVANSDHLRIKDMIKVVCIMMFHLNEFCNEDTSQSPEEVLILGLQTRLFVGVFNALLLPVHTVKQGQALVDYNALPLIKLMLDWMLQNASVLQHPAFLTKQQIWPSLAKAFNELKAFESKVQPDSIPLPEEFDLQAFQPLNQALKGYNFRQVLKGCTLDIKIIKNIRVVRMLQQAQALIEYEQFIKLNAGGLYEAVETSIPQEMLDAFENQLHIDEESQSIPLEETLPLESCKKKGGKNVAMAAILKQASMDTKQVSFKTPSPNFSQDSNISQEEPLVSSGSKTSFLFNKPGGPANAVQRLPILHDFSVPPPPIRWPSADPGQASGMAANLRAPTYQLFGGSGPAWCLPAQQRQQGPPPRPHLPPQHFMFQPGPSPLEKLLQQHPKPPQ